MTDKKPYKDSQVDTHPYLTYSKDPKAGVKKS